MGAQLWLQRCRLLSGTLRNAAIARSRKSRQVVEPLRQPRNFLAAFGPGEQLPVECAQLGTNARATDQGPVGKQLDRVKTPPTVTARAPSDAASACARLSS